jgi:flagellar protein FliO/FliZ
MVINPLSILTAAAALIAVLGLIWLAGRAARFGGMAQRPATGRLLAIEDVIALDTRHRLYVVRYEERRVLLLTGGAHDVVVGWLDRKEPPA